MGWLRPEVADKLAQPLMAGRPVGWVSSLQPRARSEPTHPKTSVYCGVPGPPRLSVLLMSHSIIQEICEIRLLPVKLEGESSTQS